MAASATLADLARLPLIHEESYTRWASWFQKAGIPVHAGLSDPRLWDANLGLDAALAGQGIALTSGFLVSGEIRDGRLVELFETNICVGGYCVLTTRSSR